MEIDQQIQQSEEESRRLALSLEDAEGERQREGTTGGKFRAMAEEIADLQK